MRSLIPTTLLVVLTAAGCRSKPAPNVAATTAPATLTPARAERESCGVVAHLDMQALAAFAGGGMVDDLWEAMLPRDLAGEGKQELARATRAATMCGDIGGEHGRQRAFVLEGAYPPDLVERLVGDRREFARTGPAAYASPRLTIIQPDARRLIVTPTEVGASWTAGIDPHGPRDSVLTLSFGGSALQDLLNGTSGLHAKQLDGVSAVRLDLARGGAMTIRIASSDAGSAAQLKEAVSDLVEGMRKGAAQSKRALPAVTARVEQSDVVVTIAFRPEEFAKTIRAVTDRVVARRPALSQLTRRSKEGK